MKLTVIGRWGGFPAPGEATAGYLLEHDGYSLLLECGSGVIASLGSIIDLKTLAAVLVTHYHYDHFCDIGPLQYARIVKTQLGLINADATLPIYAPSDETFFPAMTLESYTSGCQFDENSKLSLGPFSITFTPNVHPVQSYGVRIECSGKVLGFTSDTSYYEDLSAFMKGADCLLCECSFYSDMDGKPAGHLNSLDTGKLAQKSDAGRLILTHLPHFGNLEELGIQAGRYCSCPVEIAAYMKTYEI